MAYLSILEACCIVFFVVRVDNTDRSATYNKPIRIAQRPQEALRSVRDFPCNPCNTFCCYITGIEK